MQKCIAGNEVRGDSRRTGAELEGDTAIEDGIETREGELQKSDK